MKESGSKSKKAEAISPEWLFQRHREAWRQQLRWAIGRDYHVVFAAQPEFTGDVNSWLIRKCHAGLQYRFTSAHQIGMFVPVEPDAMPKPMREKFVIRAIAGVGNDPSGGIIHCARQLPRARSVVRGGLRFANALKAARHLFRRLA